MGRKKKKKVQYDSKETMTFLGLMCLLLSFFFLISIFTQSDGDSTLFSRAKSLFGSATIFLSAFLLLSGLKFIGVKVKFVKTINQITQFIVIVLLAGLFTAFTANPSEVIKLEPSQTKGGEIGYFIVRNIFGDIIPTEPATRIIILLLIFILLPIALSMSLHSVVEKLKKVFQLIFAFIKYILGRDKESNEEEQEEEVAVETIKASRFGDFNELLAKKKQTRPEVVNIEEDEEESESLKTKELPFSGKKPTTKDDNTTVEFKEATLGDEGLKQEQIKFPEWQLPPLSLLIPFKRTKSQEPTIKQNANIIEQILESFNVEAKVEDAYVGPSVVQYALNIPLGIKVNKIQTLAENIALALGVDSKAVRIESIPETTYLGIEVPRSTRDMVRIKELMGSANMIETKMILPVPIGKDINGEPVIADIEKMPHLLIAGATGSGKSVLTNGFINSLIMKKSPDELRLILVDPKQVEFIDYNGIAHLLTPVITDMDKVVNALKWAVGEMERRYTILAQSLVRNISGYNQKKGFAAMPYIVIVIDEMADMMMTANRIDAENAIVRLAQKARAVGIHLILATQRPSVNVITGIIKANIPGRVAMSVTSSTDARVILDRIGAESLMGKGDLLYKAPDKTKAVRLQCANIEQDEITRVVDFIKSQAPEVEYIPEITEKHMSPDEQLQDTLGDISGDNLVEQAIRIVAQSGKGSSSYLQRRLNIGFNRAARLLEELEEAGVVGPANGSKPREVLISDADSFIAQLRGGE
jgi:DNA segregation ATPase FtsK/SpoIIIE-like protein